MSASQIRFVVYLVGVVALGLFQQSVRESLGSDGWAFAVVVVYLVCLRILGSLLARLMKAK
ncbi:sensor histidine kinase regulating citrate/malate metabolism [Rhodoferax ferrireducens]|uniref:Sensor histidine kinase regulating citrate/malate metabolism n=1 Tax=Rhodoferax ferrireducens TaxID=192843 RepID=A0ABU2C3F2_9BURK|nr:hypothetical protein [Rhodoferax ferrireducens]MDR7375865.1 sensor histidine kinase regulating citrate/malate metabolism [Rhodoferax ferrireducens]